MQTIPDAAVPMLPKVVGLGTAVTNQAPVAALASRTPEKKHAR